MYRIGDRTKIAEENDNDNYDSFRDTVLIVTHVATNKNQHPGFDEGVGQPLYDLETEDGRSVPFSLYEYELEDA